MQRQHRSGSGFLRDGGRLDVTADQMAVEAVAVAASHSTDVADKLVGHAVTAHVDGMKDVVVESNAAVPTVERGEVAFGRRAVTGGRLVVVVDL